MCYTYNSFSIILITFYALLIIIPPVVKVIKNPKKVVSVNRSDFNPAKKIVYSFAAFLYAEIRVFVDFFLNKKPMSFLTILLNIVLKINK